ncbi:MAG: 6-phosphogluconolactonase [Verrucomicrobiales bacterium]
MISVSTFSSPQEAVRSVADELEALIRRKAALGKKAVLGLATGSTPLPLYAELIRRHREEGLSFANVVSFNLDEYEGLARDHEESYWHFMWENLFDHLDVDPGAVHLPPGLYAAGEVAAHCQCYEEAIREAGGLDWQLLGIGRTGHIGFNEPGSEKDTRTRRVELAEVTRRDAAAAFGGIGRVPTHAVTMGVRTILEAKRVVLMAWGEKKRAILERAFTGEVGPEVPASWLQEHSNVHLVLDSAAGEGLDSISEKNVRTRARRPELSHSE